ncbi:MAG: hypothetical protein H0X15_14020 [Acidobacteria bacterium]|jgi:hypothetical protein|nr:hypothetical protein [Acidobacteriota bacterium]MBA3786627.1 hypothetical protein [Acidobacteriota bacterium]MBA4124936.1 hypothetical protein [Acidobacteriota bacterium]HEV8159108.1 hypothetical protein [Pyrinomonadaceae bacterium]
MAIEKKKFAIDEKVERLCSACDTESEHSVMTVTKLGQITKLMCDVCSTVSTFKSGVKTSVGMTTKAGSPYDRTRKYRKGQAMMHSTFGQGEVTAVIEPQKIDVLFGDQVRRLIHAQA